MGRKHVISKRTIGGADTSNVEQGGGYIEINSDYTSEDIRIAETDLLSFHFQWRDSTLDAEIFVQVRNGDQPWDNWRNLDFGSPILIAGTSGEHDITLLAMPFTYVRLFIDVASGDGEIGSTFTAKSQGN